MAFFARLCCISALISVIMSEENAGKASPKIAVIGGGVGGASAVHNTFKLYKGHMLGAPTVDVYEKGDLGGRARAISFKGQVFESGGSVLHPRNQLMSKYAEELGLDKLETPSSRFSFYDGEEIIFTSSSWGIANFVKLLWRYGRSVVYLQDATAMLLTDFDRIYMWQKDMQSFTTVPNLLLSMSDEVMNLTQMSFTEALSQAGVNELTRNEIAMAGIRCNYGQDVLHTQGLVGMISMAGMDGGLWSVRGGNDLIPKGLIKNSPARLVHEEVTTVTKLKNGTLNVLTASGVTTNYDIVIMAAPLVEGEKNIQFVGFKSDMTEHYRPYERIITTFVKGIPNYAQFGFTSMEDFPGTILVTSENLINFNSLGYQYTTGGKPSDSVYKLFSSNPLSEKDLDQMFSTREGVEAVDWKAYPHYSASAEFPPFLLSEGLYYSNAIEMAASAMEMSAIGGKNAALLAFAQWYGTSHTIDNMFVIQEKHLKIEL